MSATSSTAAASQSQRIVQLESELQWAYLKIQKLASSGEFVGKRRATELPMTPFLDS